MVRGEKNVFLRKIDIGNWNTVITAKYKVQSIPNFRLFGPDLRQLGEPTTSVRTIAERIRERVRGT